MSTIWYKLVFGNVEMGDELIMPASSWRALSKPTTGGGLQEVVALDDRPLGLVLSPAFRIRKVADDFLQFERWLFDLATWADGQNRWLIIRGSDDAIYADYGYCKLVSLKRPRAGDVNESRWSDQVVIEFQSDTTPTFVV